MDDLGRLKSQLTSSYFGRDVKVGVSCLDAACTVGLYYFSVVRNPDKPTQNKLKKKNKNKLLWYDTGNSMKFLQLLKAEKRRTEKVCTGSK